MKEVIVTGSAGFIGSWTCRELLGRGYKVVGFDDYSKYGVIEREHDKHPNYELVKLDLSSNYIPSDLNPSFIIHCCAKVGGIRYFNERAFDLIASNAIIDAKVVAAAVNFFLGGNLERFIGLSSSMVYEGCDKYAELHHKDPWPTSEGMERIIPPPQSTYGFSKLHQEMLIKGAYLQYGLPYTIIRPFNASGSGEEDRLGDSHVIPDLVWKALSNPEDFSILGDGRQQRCYTSVRDIARGIVDAMESPKALNGTYNLSTDRVTSVMELAQLIWKRIYPDRPFICSKKPALENDVRKRIPNTFKAAADFKFEAKVSLEDSVDEVIEEMKKHL